MGSTIVGRISTGVPETEENVMSEEEKCSHNCRECSIFQCWDL